MYLYIFTILYTIYYTVYSIHMLCSSLSFSSWLGLTLPWGTSKSSLFTWGAGCPSAAEFWEFIFCCLQWTGWDSMWWTMMNASIRQGYGRINKWSNHFKLMNMWLVISVKGPCLTANQGITGSKASQGLRASKTSFQEQGSTRPRPNVLVGALPMGGNPQSIWAYMDTT